MCIKGFGIFFTATGQLRREISIRRTVGYGERLITDLDTHDEFFFFFAKFQLLKNSPTFAGAPGI